MPVQPTAVITEAWTRNEIFDHASDSTQDRRYDNYPLSGYPVASRTVDHGAQWFQVYGWRKEITVNKWMTRALTDPMLSSDLFHDTVLYSHVAPAYCNGVCDPQIQKRNEAANFVASGFWNGVTTYTRTTRLTPRVIFSDTVDGAMYDLKIGISNVVEVQDRSPSCELSPGIPVDPTTVKINGKACDASGFVTFVVAGYEEFLDLIVAVSGKQYIRWNDLWVEYFDVHQS